MNNKERHSKYVEIIARATVMGYIKEQDATETMMDIESADKKFNLRLNEWLRADAFNFAHDFLGIRNTIVRDDFQGTDFGMFVARFANYILREGKS